MDKQSDKKTGKQEVKLQMPANLQRGLYANAFNVVVSDSEVVLDFAFIFSPDGKTRSGEIISRVIVPPALATKLIHTLGEVIKQHARKQK